MNNPLISPGIGVFFWMLIAFGILFFILAKFGWPIILKTLKTREDEINKSLAAAEKANEEMRQLQCHNEELLKQAKLEREEILRTARQTSEKIVEDARKQASEEAARIVQSAQDNLEFEKLKAMHELKNQIGNLAIEISEKLIKAELSDHKKANDLIERELNNTHL